MKPWQSPFVSHQVDACAIAWLVFIDHEPCLRQTFERILHRLSLQLLQIVERLGLVAGPAIENKFSCFLCKTSQTIT
jgi:hypothetical protein